MIQRLGIQYSYPKSDSLEYRISESIKRFFSRTGSIPRTIRIPRKEFDESLDESKSWEDSNYYTFEGSFNYENTDYRFTVRVEFSHTLTQYNVWCLIEDNPFYAKKLESGRFDG